MTVAPPPNTSAPKTASSCHWAGIHWLSFSCWNRFLNYSATINFLLNLRFAFAVWKTNNLFSMHSLKGKVFNYFHRKKTLKMLIGDWFAESVQSQQWRHQNKLNEGVLLSLLLTLNISNWLLLYLSAWNIVLNLGQESLNWFDRTNQNKALCRG